MVPSTTRRGRTSARKHHPLNVRFKFARTLHFKNDDAVQEHARRSSRACSRRTRASAGRGGVAAADKKARRAATCVC